MGLYENGVKFDEISATDHASEALPKILNDLQNSYNIAKIIYTNTPGSFMGLKIAYVVLKTFCMVKGCEFAAVSGFDLNGGGAIRANKMLCFVKKGDDIKIEPAEAKNFMLPLNLDSLKLNSDTLPNYIIQAV